MTDTAASLLPAWCERWLGSAPVETLFTRDRLSHVEGVRLADGRSVVVKVRVAQSRLAGCQAVHQHLWRNGFPCAEPLIGPRPLVEGSDLVATAERFLPAGERPVGVVAYAETLADLIRSTPAPAEVPSLEPPPPWLHWYHHHEGVWPPNLDQVGGFWLDEVGRLARQRLAGFTAPAVIGHGRFEAEAVQWRDGGPWAVHGWASMVCEPEAVIVGQAAAVWTAGAGNPGASVAQVEEFLAAYQQAAARIFEPDEIEVSWAAGLWVRAYRAKRSQIDVATDPSDLGRDDAEERLRRAGMRPRGAVLRA